MTQTKQQAKNAELLAKWLKENLPHIVMKNKAEYRNVRTAITFICEEHGEYTAQPTSVKQAKHGCKMCGGLHTGKAKQLSFKEFVKTAISTHGGKYEYDESSWQGSSNKTKILCKICNTSFEQLGIHHLRDHGCPVCANKSQQLPFEDFVKRAISTHGDKYEYDENSWRGSSNKTKIFCKTCNDYFEQRADTHLQGHGCPVCNTGGGDGEKNFARNQDLANEPCKLYYIKINNSYKIGITKTTLTQRYSGQEFKTLLVRETTRLFAWRAEQMILSEFAEHKQRGNINGGSTECFSIDISTLENFHEIFNHNFTEPIQ